MKENWKQRSMRFLISRMILITIHLKKPISTKVDEQDLDFAEDEVTINDLTGEFAALQDDEKNKSEDLS